MQLVGELAIAMRHGGALERRTHFRGGHDRSGEKAHGLAHVRDRRHRRLELLDGNEHRLERRGRRADERPERLEPEMAVQLRLSQRPGDDREVVAALAPDAQQQIDEATKDDAMPVGLANSQQAELADAAAGRQVRIDAAELLIEREGALIAHGDHADDRAAIDRDEIRVFFVKAIDMAPIGIRRMLRNLLDEGLVGELEDLLEVGRLGRDAEPNGLGSHDWARLCQYSAPMSHARSRPPPRGEAYNPASIFLGGGPQCDMVWLDVWCFSRCVRCARLPRTRKYPSAARSRRATDPPPGVTVEARSNVLPTPRVVTTGPTASPPPTPSPAKHGHVHALRHAAGDARG